MEPQTDEAAYYADLERSHDNEIVAAYSAEAENEASGNLQRELTLSRLFLEREHNLDQAMAFALEHEAVINQYREFAVAQAAIDTEIRELAAAGDEDEFASGRTMVRITRKAAPKSYDAAILLANRPELEKDQPGLIKKTVDSKKAQALGKKGVIPEAVMAAALKLGAAPAPSVSIETAAAS